jgi:putative endonuclease
MPQEKISLKYQKGLYAEQLVADVLSTQGWYILARNFRTVGAELDLVAQKGDTLAIVEVKARIHKPSSLAEAEALLAPRKRAALERGGLAFLAKFGINPTTIRLDLAIVWGKKPPYGIEYVVNV